MAFYVKFTASALILIFMMVASTTLVRAVNIGDAFMIDDKGARPVSGYAYKTIGEFIAAMIPNVMVIANLILFFLILIGGLMMIKNSGNPQKQAEASAIITSSLLGFIIIFAAYWIMQVVSTILGYNVIGSTI